MKKIYEYICKTEVLISKISLIIIAVLIFTAAIARCVGHPLIWAVDISTFLFAWVVFLSGDIAMRNDKLVNIDLVTKLMPQKVQNIFKIINQLIAIAFFLALIVYGLWLSYTTRFRTFPGITSLSYTWVTLSVPVGSALMLITSVRKLKENFKEVRECKLKYGDDCVTKQI